MRNVTIDLDQLSSSCLYELAMHSTDKNVLESIYQIGAERQEAWFFIRLAQNKCPEIKEILEKICGSEHKELLYNQASNIYNYLANNPYTPPEVLGECLERSVISDALGNSSTPAEALNKVVPELFGYKTYFCNVLVSCNGEKLSDENLTRIAERYPEIVRAREILDERKK